MRTARRTALVLAALILASVALAGCSRTTPLLCRDTLTEGVVSPDGALVANLVVRDCHFAGGYEVFVSLRSIRNPSHGPPVAAYSGAWPPTLAWKGARRLVVLPDARSKVLYQQSVWDGVSLEFGPPRETDSEGKR
jgi:hypothetical protein